MPTFVCFNFDRKLNLCTFARVIAKISIYFHVGQTNTFMWDRPVGSWGASMDSCG